MTLHNWHHLDAPRYYIDAFAGDDATAAVGSPARPWRSLTGVWRAAQFAGRSAVVALRCGGDYPGQVRLHSGESEARPFVVCSYGDGNRPRILPTARDARLFQAVQSTPGRPPGLQDCHVSDIEFCVDHFDPDSPRLDLLTSAGAGSIVANAPSDAAPPAVYHRITFDGCVFRWRGPSFQKFRRIDPASTGVTIRRSVFVDTYPTGGHNSGIFSDGFPLAVEGCYFLHCGHARDPRIAELSQRLHGRTFGRATIFNHNAYLESERLRFVGNVLWCGASMGLKLRHDDPTDGPSGLVVEDNLFIDNEFPMGCVGNKDGVPGRCRSPRIAHNVSLYDGRSPHTGRRFSWPYLFNGLVDPVITGNIYARPAYRSPAYRFANADSEGGVFAGNLASDVIGGVGLRADLLPNGKPMRQADNRLDLVGAVPHFDDAAMVPVWERQRPGVSWDCRATASSINEGIRLAMRRAVATAPANTGG